MNALKNNNIFRSTYCPDQKHEEPPFKVFFLMTITFWFMSGISVMAACIYASGFWLVFYGVVWAWFLTGGRWTTCARCERYGKTCGSMGLGYLTALYLPKRDGVRYWSYFALVDIVCCMVVLAFPFFFLWRFKLLFIAYTILLTSVQIYHSRMVCINCPVKICPMHKHSCRVYGSPV
jgi:hypothetical protein